MEKETIVPTEGKEMNFFDLCVACVRAIGRGCAAFGRLLAHMLRLTYRYWWLVITMVILSIAAALYYTREDNLTRRVNAIALLNGPSIQQFEQVYTPLMSGCSLSENDAITSFLVNKQVNTFATYRVIDCLHDEVPDYVDFKRRSSNTDTLKVQMQDRLCLQFLMKNRDLVYMPAVEKALMDYLNSDEVLQQAYRTYLVNLREEVAFNHRQAQKLDSLTSCYYYQSAGSTQPDLRMNSGVSFYGGERKIRLFLNEIYKQHAHLQRFDQRLQLATAPVTLEQHFAVDPIAVNGRFKCLVLFFLFGWCVACALAKIIDKRKAIIAWLQAK